MQNPSLTFPSAEAIQKLLNPKVDQVKALANWDLILAEFDKRKINDKWNLGTALATILVETARTIEPIKEFGDAA